jgi:hypothetical protein
MADPKGSGEKEGNYVMRRDLRGAEFIKAATKSGYG